MAVFYSHGGLLAGMHALAGRLLARTLALRPTRLLHWGGVSPHSSLWNGDDSRHYEERQRLLARRSAGPLELTVTGSVAARSCGADLWEELRAARKPAPEGDSEATDPAELRSPVEEG